MCMYICTYRLYYLGLRVGEQSLLDVKDNVSLSWHSCNGVQCYGTRGVWQCYRTYSTSLDTCLQGGTTSCSREDCKGYSCSPTVVWEWSVGPPNTGEGCVVWAWHHTVVVMGQAILAVSLLCCCHWFCYGAAVDHTQQALTVHCTHRCLFPLQQAYHQHTVAVMHWCK